MKPSRIEFQALALAFLEKEARADSNRASNFRRSIEIKLLIDGADGAATGPLIRGKLQTFLHTPNIGNGEYLRFLFEVTGDLAIVWAISAQRYPALSDDDLDF